MAAHSTHPGTDIAAQQRALYGTTLAERFGPLLHAYGITQARLAATIGLSAPMLSQLVGGTRAKITNPAVLARVLLLEELTGSHEVRSGDRAAIDATLARVAASRPQLTTESATVETSTPASPATLLAALATATELRAAAQAVPGTALAAALSAAADSAATT